VDLKRAWHEEWDKLTLTEINSFIEKLPKRVQQVIDCGGSNNFHG